MATFLFEVKQITKVSLWMLCYKLPFNNLGWFIFYVDCNYHMKEIFTQIFFYLSLYL